MLPFGLLALCGGVRRHLTEVEVARAVQLLEEGHTQREVADRMDVAPSVINRAVETLPGRWPVYQKTRSGPQTHDNPSSRPVFEDSCPTEQTEHH